MIVLRSGGRLNIFSCIRLTPAGKRVGKVLDYLLATQQIIPVFQKRLSMHIGVEIESFWVNGIRCVGIQHERSEKRAFMY
jgi:hypothetical protein